VSVNVLKNSIDPWENHEGKADPPLLETAVSGERGDSLIGQRGNSLEKPSLKGGGKRDLKGEVQTEGNFHIWLKGTGRSIRTGDTLLA